MFSRKKIHPIEEYFNQFINTEYEIISKLTYPVKKELFKNQNQFIKFEDIEDSFNIEIFEEIIKWYNLNNLFTGANKFNKEAMERYIEADYLKNEKLADRIKKDRGNGNESYNNIHYLDGQNIRIKEFQHAKKFAKTIFDKIKPSIDKFTFELAKKIYKPDIKYVDTINTIGKVSIELDETNWNTYFKISKTIFDNVFYKMLVYYIIKYNLVNCINPNTSCTLNKENITGLCNINREQIINLLNTDEVKLLVINMLYQYFIDFYNGMNNNLDKDNLLTSITIKFYLIILLILEGFIKTNKEKIFIKKINDKYIGLYARESKVKEQTLEDIKYNIKHNLSTGISYFDLETGKDILTTFSNDEEKEEFIEQFKKATGIIKLDCNSDNPLISKGLKKNSRSSFKKRLSLLENITAGGFFKKYKNKNKKQTKITKHKKRKSKTNKKH